MYKAYLAGPITGCSFGECTDWRQWFVDNLPDVIQGMSPMRGKTYLEGEQVIGDHYGDSDNKLMAVMSSQKGITARDHNDCRTCDILIVNLIGAERVSIGTVMEIAWADAYNKPIVLIMEPEGNLHDHAMIRETVNFRVESLEEALHLTKVILLPAPHTKDGVWEHGS